MKEKFFFKPEQFGEAILAELKKNFIHYSKIITKFINFGLVQHNKFLGEKVFGLLDYNEIYSSFSELISEKGLASFEFSNPKGSYFFSSKKEIPFSIKVNEDLLKDLSFFLCTSIFYGKTKDINIEEYYYGTSDILKKKLSFFFDKEHVKKLETNSRVDLSVSLDFYLPVSLCGQSFFVKGPYSYDYLSFVPFMFFSEIDKVLGYISVYINEYSERARLFTKLFTNNELDESIERFSAYKSVVPIFDYSKYPGISEISYIKIIKRVLKEEYVSLQVLQKELNLSELSMKILYRLTYGASKTDKFKVFYGRIKKENEKIIVLYKTYPINLLPFTKMFIGYLLILE